ncbi:unnamed protein product [Allacma fusca]|uniref:Reelin domain-containing protein n=1 Tax=Allacma fusca TaxID=39272 RepID=A0A8J2JVY8_9HEXA|nr:unnamed protein product [Allacma fusca]
MTPPKIFLMTFFSVILSVCDIVESNAGGGPTTPETCMNMKPKHGVEPQSDPSPYTIYSSKSEVKAGETVKLQICSSKEKIKGFYVQGRKMDFMKETAPMGSFMLEEGSEKNSKLVSCSGGIQNTITHTNNNPKEHVNFIWNAPKEPGTYVIVCTIAKNGATFWVNETSMKITVI